MSTTKLEEAREGKALAQTQLDYARMYMRDLVQQSYDAGKNFGASRSNGILSPTANTINLGLEGLEKAAVKFSNESNNLRVEERIASLNDQMSKNYGEACERLDVTATLRGTTEDAIDALATVGPLDPEPFGSHTILVPKGGPLDDVYAQMAGRVERRVGAIPELAAGFGTWPVTGGAFPSIQADLVSPDGTRKPLGKGVDYDFETFSPAPDWTPREGALRGRGGDNALIAANPGDLLFSTVTMIASEVYNGTSWEPIEGIPSASDAIPEPTNAHGQTCAETCGAMAASGLHSALCHTIESIRRATTSKP